MNPQYRTLGGQPFGEPHPPTSHYGPPPGAPKVYNGIDYGGGATTGNTPHGQPQPQHFNPQKPGHPGMYGPPAGAPYQPQPQNGPPPPGMMHRPGAPAPARGMGPPLQAPPPGSGMPPDVNQLSHQVGSMHISQQRGNLPPGGGPPGQRPPGSGPPPSRGPPPQQFGAPPHQQPTSGHPPTGSESQFPPPGGPPPSGGMFSQGSMPPASGMAPPPGSQSQLPPASQGLVGPPLPPFSGGVAPSSMSGPMQTSSLSYNIQSPTPPPSQAMQHQHPQGFMGGPPMQNAAFPNQANGPVGQYPGSVAPYGVQHQQPQSQMSGPLPPPPSQPGSYHQTAGYPQQPLPQGGPPGNRMQSPLAPPAQAAQQRKLDPDQMPSPIQVIEEDRKNRSEPFYTNTRGQVPPLVTTDFTVHDEGICGPRFMRSTIYSVPCTPDMLRQTSVPFALAITPFARQVPGENHLPMTDFGEQGPVRCNRCKAYMSPFMQFIDGGRRFQCVFCKGTTEVPAEYFAHLDHMGQRSDKFQRPELCLGSYEIIATKQYCKNEVFPKPPAFLFLLDVSYNSVRNGLIKLFCENIRKILAHLPKDEGMESSEVRVGFLTYSSVVHFYNIKAILPQPQMLVVPDVNEMFVPLLEGCLVSVDEAQTVIDSLMEQIPIMFADTRETETILGPAIQAGLEALKAAECAGKLFVFHTTLPISDAPGKLKNRDDRKLLSTDKEKTILTPQTTFYNNLGQECVAAGCCVDLFFFHNAYIDIATIGQVSKLTGGQVYKYTYFQANIDGERFLEDLKRDVAKPIAFDCVMRVRTSTGIRPTDFYGNYFMSNTTDVELAALDCDKCIAVEIKYDDKLTEEDGAYIQAAVLYTSCGGQRRLRIHNLALNTCSQMADMYRNCELDTIMNFISKQALRQLLEQSPRQIKDGYINRSAQILASYRKNCASPSSSGQLILPECMKLLPLYINCMLKCDAISGGPDMSTDDRSFIMLSLCSMDVKSSVAYLYPRLIPLHDLDPNSTDMPVALRCSIEKISDTGVYLLENGIYMFLWIGMAVNPDWLQNVFGQQVAARIDIDKPSLIELNTPISQRVRDVIERVRHERQRFMRLNIVRQGDKLELVFRQFLVEDRHSDGSPSYVDFLCHLHKEIRSLLS